MEDYSISETASPLSLADRWIRSRLNLAVKEVIAGLDEYRFNEAAAAIYQFIWHELCDWYVEMVKLVLYGKSEAGARQAAQSTLLFVLTGSLKLVHPFMPFVTEELWQHLLNPEKSIMVSDFPQADEARHDAEAERHMESVMGVITSIRNIRGEMGIPPSKKLQALIHPPHDEMKAILLNNFDYIFHLANLEELVIDYGEEPKGAATGIFSDIKVFVKLDGHVDIAGERLRLEKKL